MRFLPRQNWLRFSCEKIAPWSARRLASSSSVCGSANEPSWKNLSRFGDSVAVVDCRRAHTYKELDGQADKVARAVAAQLKNRRGDRVCYLCPNNADYFKAKLGVWKSGHVAVPLCKTHPSKMLEYYIQDSDASLVLASREFVDKVHGIIGGRQLLVLEDVLDSSDNSRYVVVEEEEQDEAAAMILYTSGTTGPPKGVVLTRENIESQCKAMEEAWRWTREDSILHVLPLHHLHGVVNCLITPLSCGAKVVMLPEFEAGEVWRHLLLKTSNNNHHFEALGNLSAVDNDRKVNLFMAVPTIYAKLLDAHKRLFSTEEERKLVKDSLRQNIRVMVSGSAALPQPVLERWRDVSGHTLLERYGMTEIGMALTNPLEPEGERRPGCVGRPFPGVEGRIVGVLDAGKENARKCILASATSSGFRIHEPAATGEGELEVTGPNVFREYFRRPAETKKEFTEDGWFKTGDTASMDESGVFRILGRSSVDIIKSGGYKISALDIERVLLSHPEIADVAVVGVEDETWGQKVGAVVTLTEAGKAFTLEDLQKWAADKMPHYHMPRLMKIMEELPRNNMGKVNKKELVKIAFSQTEMSK